MEEGFPQMCVPVGRDKACKVKEQRFRLGRRSCFSSMKTLKQWIKLPREVMQSSFLDIFKASLGKVLNNLI